MITRYLALNTAGKAKLREICFQICAFLQVSEWDLGFSFIA